MANVSLQAFTKEITYPNNELVAGISKSLAISKAEHILLGTLCCVLPFVTPAFPAIKGQRWGFQEMACITCCQNRAFPTWGLLKETLTMKCFFSLNILVIGNCTIQPSCRTIKAQSFPFILITILVGNAVRS